MMTRMRSWPLTAARSPFAGRDAREVSSRKAVSPLMIAMSVGVRPARC